MKTFDELRHALPGAVAVHRGHGLITVYRPDTDTLPAVESWAAATNGALNVHGEPVWLVTDTAFESLTRK
jgi:hypothetical protein